MIGTAFALGLGQLCAVGIHTLTWCLRRRALWLLALGGVGALLYAAYVLASFDVPLQDSGGSPRLAWQDNLRDTLGILLWVIVPASILGLYHSFLLGCRWRWWRWPASTLAAEGELGIGVWFYLWYSPPHNRMSAILTSTDARLMCQSLLVTLAALAVFRPLVLKFVRPVIPMVQRAMGRRETT